MIENVPVKVDDVGRIVIPKKVRKELEINVNDILLLSLHENKIQMEKREDCNELQKIKKKLQILNKEYNLDIILANNENVVYSNLEDLKDKKVNKDIKKIELNKVFKKEKTILTEDCSIDNPHYYCSFYLDIYTKYNLFIIYKTKKEEEYAKLMCYLLIL